MPDDKKRDSSSFTPLPKSPLERSEDDPSNPDYGGQEPENQEQENPTPSVYPEGSYSGNSDSDTSLEAQLAAKDREIAELMETFQEVKAHVAQYNEQISVKEERIKFLEEQLGIMKASQEMKGEGITSQMAAKDEQMKTLQASLEMKGEQIDALKSSLELKDGQIQTLKENQLIKDEQVKTLKEDLAAKDKQIQEILAEVQEMGEGGASSEEVEQLKGLIGQKDRLLEEKEERITKLEEEIKLLNKDLDATDSDIEEMQKEIEELRGQGGLSGDMDLKTIRLGRETIVTKLSEIINRAIHNITVVAPSITDLEDLNIFEVPSSVNIKVSCLVDQTIDTHNDLLMEYESLDNLSIRSYEAQDRWAISKDNEELFLAAVGAEENESLAFHTVDEKHIKLFNPIIMEAWLRARKI